MGFIPKDAKWYLADIVQEITVEGDSRNVVHTNLVLVRADSPEEAYQKATELGAEGEQSYENIDGQHVTFCFRGLRELQVIHDELEHGAELSYREDIGVEESTIRKWVADKEELGVFRPTRPSTGPDYGSGDVIEEMYRQFPHLRPKKDKSKPN
jgi:Domain of unknown function (DUF4288)